MKVGLHQGSILSPLLFAVIMDVVEYFNYCFSVVQVIPEFNESGRH